ncbi:MAG: tetratricopeptide repeat protein, partial [Ginsengibacter sp.]
MVSVTSGLLNFLFTIIGVSELLQIIRSYPSLHKETWCCGYGVDQDINEAYSWYLKAAKSGHMESQYNIGFFHKEGEIVKKNFRKAVHWFSLAASKGDTEAQ